MEVCCPSHFVMAGPPGPREARPEDMLVPAIHRHQPRRIFMIEIMDGRHGERP